MVDHYILYQHTEAQPGLASHLTHYFSRVCHRFISTNLFFQQGSSRPPRIETALSISASNRAQNDDSTSPARVRLRSGHMENYIH